MSKRGKLLGTFVIRTLCYGVAAFITVVLTAIRTCGITPDTVELCNLTALTVVQVALGIGYAAPVIHFYRTRVSGRL